MWRTLAIAVVAGCWTGDAAPLPETPPKPLRPAIAQLSPPGLDNVWLGMTLDQLRLARPKAKDIGYEDHDPDIVYEEKNPSSTIKSATYFIRRRHTSRNRVYHIGVTYRDPTEASRLFENFYAPRGKKFPKGWDDDKMSEQIRIRGHAFLVGVWTYDDGLSVAGALPATKYEGGEFQTP